MIKSRRLSTIRKPSQAKRKQHSDINRKHIDCVCDGSDNRNKDLTFLHHLCFSCIFHFIIILLSIFFSSLKLSFHIQYFSLIVF